MVKMSIIRKYLDIGKSKALGYFCLWRNLEMKNGEDVKNYEIS